MSWAEIKKAVNSDLGKPLNEVLRQKHVFTGNGYIDIPSTISEVFVTAIAAGGDGEEGRKYLSPSESGAQYGRGGYGGRGGDCGEYVINHKMSVVPGQRIHIIVGEGNTFVGESLVLLKGAGPLKGGKGGSGANATLGGTGNPGEDGEDGESSYEGGSGKGGKGGTPAGAYTGGGGGGGGGAGVPKEFVINATSLRLGDGASGGPKDVETPAPPSSALTLSNVYGAGGGGGGGGGAKGSTTPTSGGNGGGGARGASGIVFIEW